MKMRILGLVIVMIASAIFGLISRVQMRQQVLTAVATSILPFLMLVFYFLSYGKKIAQMVFLNCDLAMLYYPFYRQPKAIIQGFLTRFKMTTAYNSAISIGLFLCFVLFGVTSQAITLTFYGVLAILLIALTLLFSFHELFIYYLLQPFTSDLTVKNPVYRFITVAFYWVCYLCTRLNFQGFGYSLFLSLLVFIYVALGFVILYKKAPQTFRLK